MHVWNQTFRSDATSKVGALAFASQRQVLLSSTTSPSERACMYTHGQIIKMYDANVVRLQMTFVKSQDSWDSTLSLTFSTAYLTMIT
jgi:UDP-N-acetylglucosamine pyrophosphorylase